MKPTQEVEAADRVVQAFPRLVCRTEGDERMSKLTREKFEQWWNNEESCTPLDGSNFKGHAWAAWQAALASTESEDGKQYDDGHNPYDLNDRPEKK